MRRYVALLRAVNVGGTGKLPMADLRAALEGLGYAQPKTLLASGNAVLGAKAGGAALEAALEHGLAETLGLKTEVHVRDHAELAAIVAGNPFARMAKEDPSHLLVMFLRGEPEASAVAALAAAIAGPEEVAAGPRALYVSYPEDIGHSKLTGGKIERALGLRGTGRNWNTVTKLAELTA